MCGCQVLGWRFKLKKDGTFGFLQGTQKTYEGDFSELLVRAVPLLGANIHVVRNVEFVFGSVFVEQINQVVLKSPFFAAHREHGCVPRPLARH